MPMDETMAEVPEWVETALAPLDALDVTAQQRNVLRAALIRLGEDDGQALADVIADVAGAR